MVLEIDNCYILISVAIDLTDLHAWK